MVAARPVFRTVVRTGHRHARGGPPTIHAARIGRRAFTAGQWWKCSGERTGWGVGRAVSARRCVWRRSMQRWPARSFDQGRRCGARFARFSPCLVFLEERKGAKSSLWRRKISIGLKVCAQQLWRKCCSADQCPPTCNYCVINYGGGLCAGRYQVARRVVADRRGPSFGPVVSGRYRRSGDTICILLLFDTLCTVPLMAATAGNQPLQQPHANLRLCPVVKIPATSHNPVISSLSLSTDGRLRVFRYPFGTHLNNLHFLTGRSLLERNTSTKLSQAL